MRRAVEVITMRKRHAAEVSKKVLASEKITGFFKGVEIIFSITDCNKYVGGIDVNFQKIDDGHPDRNFPKHANLLDGRLTGLKGAISQKEIAKDEIKKYFNHKKRNEDPKQNKRKKIKKIRQSKLIA